MTHRIWTQNWRIVQKAEGGLSPILQLQTRRDHGDAGVERILERRRLIADNARACVEAERVEAIARGIHVIYEETRDDSYSYVALPDEGPYSGK
jgi:hypothetical protein